MNLGTISATVGLNTAPLKAGVAQAQGMMTGLDRSMNAAANKSGSAWKQGGAMIASGLATVGTLAAVAGVASVKMAADFDSAMHKAWSVTDATKEQMQGWSDQVLDLSKKFPQSAEKMAEALYWIKSDMPSATEAEQMKTLEIAAMGATGGVAELEDATEALITAQNAYGVTDPAGFMDTMTWAVKRGSITLQDFVANQGKAVGTAAIAGVSFKELAAAVATITRKGVPADTAFMSLNQTMMGFLKPTQDAADTAAKYGVELSMAALKSKGLGGALLDIAQKIPDEELANLFPNVRALKSVFPLAGTAAEEFANDLNLAGQASGTTAAMFEKNMDDIKNKWAVAWNNLKAPMIEFGNALMPFVTTIVQALSTLPNTVNMVFLASKQAVQQYLVGLFTAAKTLGDVLEHVPGPLGKMMTELKLTSQGALGGLRNDIQETALSYAQASGEMETVNAEIIAAFAQLPRGTREAMTTSVQAIRDALASGQAGLAGQMSLNMDGMISAIASKMPGAEGKVNELTDALVREISSADFYMATSEQMNGIAAAIAAETDVPVATVVAMLNTLRGEIGGADFGAALTSAMSGMPGAVGAQTGPTVEEGRRLNRSFKGIFEDDPAEPVVGAPVGGEAAIMAARWIAIGMQRVFNENPAKPVVSEATKGPGSGMKIYNRPEDLGEHIGELVVGGMQVGFAKNAPSPQINIDKTLSAGWKALTDSFGSFMAQMNSEPVNELNDAIRGLTNTNWELVASTDAGVKAYEKQLKEIELQRLQAESRGDKAAMDALDAQKAAVDNAKKQLELQRELTSLSGTNMAGLEDWKKVQIAYDNATKSLAKYEAQIESAEAAIKKTEAVLEKLRQKYDQVSNAKFKGQTAADDKSFAREQKLNQLQLAIMKADDAHNYELAAKLTLQKESLERTKEEADLANQIRYDPLERTRDKILNPVKEMLPKALFAQLKSLQSQISKQEKKLAKQQKQKDVLDIRFTQAQKAVDRFKKVMDDLSSWLIAKWRDISPASYQHGGPVGATGLALVHEGEYVLTPEMQRQFLKPLNVNSSMTTTIVTPVVLDGREIARVVSRAQGNKASAYRMSGGRY